MKKYFLSFMILAVASINILAQPVMVKDIFPGTTGSDPAFGAIKNNVLYFGATLDRTTSDGAEVFRTDGTSDGTYLFKQFRTAGSGLVNPPWGPFNGKVYIQGLEDDPGISYERKIEFWKTDGSMNGTIKVKTLSSEFEGFTQFTYCNNILFMRYRDYDYLNNKWPPATESYQLWKTDGTSRGTVIVKDIYSRGDEKVSNLIDVNGTLFFWATNGTNGKELWKSNGTSNGTVMVKNIDGTSSDSYFDHTYTLPRNLTLRNSNQINVNGTLYFTAKDASNGYEVWKSNGTEIGTVWVTNINTSGNSNPHGYCKMGDYIYFSATSGSDDYELYKIYIPDGSVSLVKDINTTGSSDPIWLTVVNNTLYFSAYHPDYGRELWKSQGTEATTELVKDITGDANSSNPNDTAQHTRLTNIFNMNGVLFFEADDGTNGIELWSSDGTYEGTYMVADINENGSSNPGDFLEMNGIIYFAANDGINGRELWKFEPGGGKRGEYSFETITLNNNDYSINIYPNPADDQFTIQADFGKKVDLNIKLVDLLGNEILSLNKLAVSSSYDNINTANLSPGLYFVEFRFGTEAVQRKIIKR